MGGTYSTKGQNEKLIQNFGWGNLLGRDHVKDLGTHGRKISR